MVIMSGTATVLQQFVSGLKSRNEDTRAKSAKDLQHYVTTELREVTAGRIYTCNRNLSWGYPFTALYTECCCTIISCLHCFRSGQKATFRGCRFFSKNIDVLFCFFTWSAFKTPVWWLFVMLCICLWQLSQDEATTFYDELNHHIFELVSSSDVNEKKGGILAIGKLLNYKMLILKFIFNFQFC